MSTFLKSYELNGVKESVANFISNISPNETPFLSTTNVEAIQNANFSWLTDVDGAVVVPATGRASGADWTFDNVVEPTKISSSTQIFSVGVKVDNTAEATGLYGRGKPMTYQMAKQGRVLKRTIETVMLSDQSAVTSSAIKGGMLDGIATKRVGGAVITNTVTAATAGTPLEAELFEVTAARYMAGASSEAVIYAHPKFASLFSALRDTNQSSNMFDGEVAVTVNKVVDVVVDPLGQRHKVMYVRNMPEDMIYIIDPAMFKQKVLRNFRTVDVPSAGDYIAKSIVVELGLANLNPDAHGIYVVGTTA